MNEVANRFHLVIRILTALLILPSISATGRSNISNTWYTVQWEQPVRPLQDLLLNGLMKYIITLVMVATPPARILHSLIRCPRFHESNGHCRWGFMKHNLPTRSPWYLELFISLGDHWHFISTKLICYHRFALFTSAWIVVAKNVQQMYQYLMLFSLLVYTVIKSPCVVIWNRNTTPIYYSHPHWYGPVLSSCSLCIDFLVAIVWVTG